MRRKTRTRIDLVDAVFNLGILSRHQASKMVEEILEEVSGALGRGETVKLSSFGSFVVRRKSQRFGRNPKTGDQVPISPRRVLKFRPSPMLKQQMIGPKVSDAKQG